MAIDDSIILEKTLDKNQKVSASKLIRLSFSEKEYLKNRFSDILDSDSLSEIVYRIQNDIKIAPVCKICQRHKAKYKPGYRIYLDFCEECYKNNLQEVKKFLYQKRKNANIEKYGYESPFCNEDSLKHCREKAKQTYLLHYGVDHPSKSDIIQKKKKETWIKKYGVDHPWKNPEIMKKCWTSLKNNHKYSKLEELVYQWLLEEFSKDDIIRQYKEERYPWHCDFYIKSLDLFIEIQGYRAHGKHPFDENNLEDLKLLEKWKELSKTKNYYNRLIEGWTVSDVKKRNIAKENNLKFQEFFIEDIIKEKFLKIIKKYA